MKVCAANTVRFHFAANAATLVLALIATMSTGCRSRSERDLVERELRMHEDQVYALEDYVAEYQEIVRRVRCENMELRRQVEQMQSADPAAEPKADSPAALPAPDDTWSPDRPRSRGLLDRRRQSVPPDPFKQEPPAAEPEASPPIPPIDAEAPDIELGDPMPVSPPATPPTATPPPSQGAAIPPVILESDAPQIVPAGVLGDARPLSQTAQIEMEVRGHWVRPEGQDSLSLHVEVEPRSEDGAPLAYEGPLEVLLLDPAAGPTAPAVARWEFTPQEVEAAWRDPQTRVTLDVLAGLPPDLPLDQALELWVRLRPRDGKVLASTLLAPYDDTGGAFVESVSQQQLIDTAISPAGHWVPTESQFAPKPSDAANGGWMPRKP